MLCSDLSDLSFRIPPLASHSPLPCSDSSSGHSSFLLCCYVQAVRAIGKNYTTTQVVNLQTQISPGPQSFPATITECPWSLLSCVPRWLLQTFQSLQVLLLLRPYLSASQVHSRKRTTPSKGFTWKQFADCAVPRSEDRRSSGNQWGRWSSSGKLLLPLVLKGQGEGLIPNVPSIQPSQTLVRQGSLEGPASRDSERTGRAPFLLGDG